MVDKSKRHKIELAQQTQQNTKLDEQYEQEKKKVDCRLSKNEKLKEKVNDSARKAQNFKSKLKKKTTKSDLYRKKGKC